MLAACLLPVGQGCVCVLHVFVVVSTPLLPSGDYVFSFTAVRLSSPGPTLFGGRGAPAAGLFAVVCGGAMPLPLPCAYYCSLPFLPPSMCAISLVSSARPSSLFPGPVARVWRWRGVQCVVLGAAPCRPRGMLLELLCVAWSP